MEKTYRYIGTPPYYNNRILCDHVDVGECKVGIPNFKITM